MINVLHIHQKFLPYQGGSTQRLLNLIRSESKEYQHIVLCKNSENVEDYSFNHGIHIYRFKKYFEIPKLMLKIRKIHGFNIIHSHNYRPAFFALFFPYFLSSHYHKLFELHSIYMPTTYLGRFLTKIVHYFYSHALVLSDSSVIALKKSGFSKPISTIYNGININRFFSIGAGKSITLQKNRNVKIGYIGSIEAFQGVEYFCKIAKEVKNCRNDIDFSVIGGEESQHIMLNKISCGSVEFSPFISSDLVPRAYAELDFLLMPRPFLPETESAIPLKPLEALASSTFVLATSVGGMVELKTKLNTNNIFLFDNISEITSWICSLDVSEKMTFYPECGLSQFDANKQHMLLEKLYKEILNG